MDRSYVLFHKPYNVLCQFTDDSSQAANRQTLKNFISVPDVYSVGRLDRDSEGLLLLTNDNQLKHYLCEPKFAHPRTYWVQVENIPDQQALKQLQQGVIIKGEKTRPAIARLLTSAPEIGLRQPPIRERKNIPTAWLELTLTEGKNRQIRRMTAAVGFPTLRLIRVAIGKAPNQLTLKNVAVGEWRHLTTAEIRMLRSPLKKLAIESKNVGRRRSKSLYRPKKTAVRRSKKRR
ncbi:pseudouridine synthase Rsu [[Leptolyngbya] sp. PCC 7376]|uniref:pseudouridine synthase n=1 Tax=[Leptolyngbya] sp. PCC 7376 TaxID=111781 RepID=UPI00029F3C6D|nr:pseudouridine synthase [[Leptolyngbya] sp. PCC 7376]AFY38101.1 pseudouridine synthase Rsu [[Leptolyngbya] sp. PCC 7376]